MKKFKKTLREQLWLDTGYWPFMWLFFRIILIIPVVLLVAFGLLISFS